MIHCPRQFHHGAMSEILTHLHIASLSLGEPTASISASLTGGYRAEFSNLTDVQEFE